MEDKKGSGEKIKVGGRKEVEGDKRKKRRWKIERNE